MAFRLANRVYTIGTIDGAQDITPGVAVASYQDFSFLASSDETLMVVRQGALWAYIVARKVGAILRPISYRDGSSGLGQTVTFAAGSVQCWVAAGYQNFVGIDADGIAINAEAVLNAFSVPTLAALKILAVPATGARIAYLRGILSGDRKGAYYLWDAASAAAADDFAVVASSLSATGRWLRQTPIIDVPPLAADSDAYNSSIYRVGDDLRHKSAGGLVKKLPRTENYVAAYYDTYADFKAAASSQWAAGDVIGFRGITEKNDAPVRYGVWDAASTNTDALDVLFLRPNDIAGSNPGRCAFSEPGAIPQFGSGDATPSVKGGRNFRVSASGVVITALDDAIDLETYTIFPGAADATLAHSSAFVMPGAQDYVLLSLASGGAPVLIRYESGVGYLIGGGGVNEAAAAFAARVYA